MAVSLEQRDAFVKMLATPYKIPAIHQEAVSHAIKEYMQGRGLSEKTINRYVSDAMECTPALRSFSAKNSNGFAHARGKITEYLVAAEYNSLKNADRGNVLYTFVNPDPRSQADLLHVIQTADGVKVVAGPDVKTGNPSYVLEQYEKACKTKSGVAFIDVEGWLTNPEMIKKLSPKQQARLEQLKRDYPHKRPRPSVMKPQTANVITRDLSKFVLFDGALPSQAQGHRFHPNSPDVRERLHQKTLEFKSPYSPKDWDVFKEDSIRAFEPQSAPLHEETPKPVSEPSVEDKDEKPPCTLQPPILTDPAPPLLKIVGKAIVKGIKQAGSWVAEHPEVIEKAVDVLTVIADTVGGSSSSKRVPSSSHQDVTVVPAENNPAPSGSVGSPKRPHERVEHFRHYKSGKVVLVRATQVHKEQL